MKKIIILTLLICFTLTFFVGCDKDSSNEIVYYELDEMPRTVDPQLAYSSSELMISRNIYEGLIREDNDGNFVNGAIKEYKQSNNVYTFTLRDNLKWSDGKPLTAQDFKYGYTRATNPINNAPYKEKLNCIKSYNVVNDSTIKIEITSCTKEDFFEILTLPVSMPCREDFFNECNGTYGMTSKTTLTNGSYRLRLWDTENNKIRIWTNPHYNGDFVSKNAAVIFTHDKEKSAFKRIEDQNVDIAKISTNDISKAGEMGLNTVEYENICWVLVMNHNKYLPTLRQAFVSAFDKNKYSQELITGYKTTNDIFPEIIKKDVELSPVALDSVSAVSLYKSAVADLKNKNPGEIKIVYYNDPVMYNALVDIAGNWQNLFGVTINIVASDDLNLLQEQILSPTYDMCLVPLISTDGNISNYCKYFATNQTNISDIQNSYVSSFKIIPVAVQNTCFAYTSDLSNIKITLKTGNTDFSYVIKN